MVTDYMSEQINYYTLNQVVKFKMIALKVCLPYLIQEIIMKMDLLP